MPMTRPGVDSKPLIVASVAIKLAHPNEMPVVTATNGQHQLSDANMDLEVDSHCPTKLNHPVTQETNAAVLSFGASIAAQK